ncbi:MAG TPA: DUF4403 family protein [Polyangiaceae bacterium]|nr:DUF4403 family protein [Polyangiaceae bacterium]
MIAAIFFGALDIGCSPSATGGGPQPTSTDDKSPRCIDPGPLPLGSDRVLSVKYPSSRLAITGQLSERWLNAQLDEQLPVVVAEERDRPIGVAGRASYRIKRGSLSLGQRADQLWATLPLSLDIALCKPFGSGCFRYGSCTPRLDIQVLLDRDFAANYELESPRLSSSTREGCRIGIDVTPQLETAAHSELAKIQRSLDRAFSRIDEAAASFAAQAHAPLPAWPEQCVDWSLNAVRQRSLRLENLDRDATAPGKYLTFGLEATGQLVAVDSCEPEPNSAMPDAFPAPRTAQTLRQSSEVHIPERLSPDVLRAALTTQLDGALHPHRVSELRLASDAVFLKVEFAARACGAAWFKSQLELVGEALHLVQPVMLSHPSGSKQLLSQIEAALTDGFAEPVRGNAWLKEQGKDWLLNLLAPAQAELRPHDLTVAVAKFHPRPAHVQIAADGVYVFHTATFQMRLEAAQRLGAVERPGAGQRPAERLSSFDTDAD